MFREAGLDAFERGWGQRLPRKDRGRVVFEDRTGWAAIRILAGGLFPHRQAAPQPAGFFLAALT